MTTTQLPLLLASASPRRRQILATLGLPYTVSVAPGDEDAAQAHYQGSVDGLGEWTAAYKALMMFSRPETANHLVITADTTVILDDQELGKPRDTEHARSLLRSLRGRWHRVVTGIVVSTMVAGQLQMHGESCSTPVLMRPYTDEEIDAYIATGDPMDKAGAYGIQSASFQPTESIDGCYYNVVGLPLCTLVRLLAKFDVHPANSGCSDTACPWSEQCHIR
ncbi:Maf family protein [Dictyobacter kobayashii]|uniref:dTTP/UTP pyrophosphatase n=1 Tax=Dictyobacter kobayashii TaxID=2014872 RepID=A0A402AMG1_9CHLR|nr:Maf family protein [Dictyobacter kobayashii]GCE20306.1 Maf-like protein [Dictyobacter kobayashii]